MFSSISRFISTLVTTISTERRWVILEIMGHDRYAGELLDERGGGALIRFVDMDGSDRIKRFGPKAIFSVAYVSEEEADKAARQIRGDDHPEQDDEPHRWRSVPMAGWSWVQRDVDGDTVAGLQNDDDLSRKILCVHDLDGRRLVVTRPEGEHPGLVRAVLDEAIQIDEQDIPF